MKRGLVLCGVTVLLWALYAVYVRYAASVWTVEPMVFSSIGTLSAGLTLLLIAGMSCCVAMAMPQVHIVAYCADLGIGTARGAEMLSLMLATGVVSRLAFGGISDRIGPLKALLLSSGLQALSLLLFLPFEGLGMLHLLMPCSRVSEVNHTSTNENDHEKNDWCGWFEEWVTMAGWMPTNRFWRAAWFAIFAQLAKHDVGDVLNWDARANELRSTCLWFMEVPVGGGEGACPFGRRTSSRAAYLFSRSVNDSEQRCKYAAKYLAYRLPS